jgi:hypothetical protein
MYAPLRVKFVCSWEGFKAVKELKDVFDKIIL